MPKASSDSVSLVRRQAFVVRCTRVAEPVEHFDCNTGSCLDIALDWFGNWRTKGRAGQKTYSGDNDGEKLHFDEGNWLFSHRSKNSLNGLV